ncbi:hypothetical protein DVV91_16975 [Clostridium botulinum]|uniref:hypothetical protein n=1 Tax=Clostridium botulinum TaxID=1491 RepID=UPI001967529B|nr:hypothetical protein [Clostridium botulinum]MBN1076016.1 hypothetical protein [Clostridium botulinum]
MLKIIIDGEGLRIKKELNNFFDADIAINLLCQDKNGCYNKTWIDVIKDNKYVCKHIRLDLTFFDKLKGLKKLLIEDAYFTIKDFQEELQEIEKINNVKWDKRKNILIEKIEECENFIKIIKSMDNEGNY